MIQSPEGEEIMVDHQNAWIQKRRESPAEQQREKKASKEEQRAK